MKLYKIENENEIWYFTSKAKCARYLGCSIQSVDWALLGKGHRAKGYLAELIEDDYVVSKFIDPEPNIYTAEELVLTKKMFELLRQVIENDKRIENLENKIEGLKSVSITATDVIDIKKNIEKVNVQK